MNPMTNVKNITKLNEKELALGVSSKTSWHNQYKESAWIFVGGLPYDLTEGDIICVFSQYGEVVNINLVRDKTTGKSKGYCFLCYEDQRSTILAVDNFNGIKILGRTIRVDHVANYKPPKDREGDDVMTKHLHSEGCAPEAMVSLQKKDTKDGPVEEKKNAEKKHKKKKKKKQKKPKHHLTGNDDREIDKDTHKNKIIIKKEKHDPAYEKYIDQIQSAKKFKSDPENRSSGARHVSNSDSDIPHVIEKHAQDSSRKKTTLDHGSHKKDGKSKSPQQMILESGNVMKKRVRHDSSNESSTSSSDASVPRKLQRSPACEKRSSISESESSSSSLLQKQHKKAPSPPRSSDVYKRRKVDVAKERYRGDDRRCQEVGRNKRRQTPDKDRDEKSGSDDNKNKKQQRYDSGGDRQKRYERIHKYEDERDRNRQYDQGNSIRQSNREYDDRKKEERREKDDNRYERRYDSDDDRHRSRSRNYHDDSRNRKSERKYEDERHRDEEYRRREHQGSRGRR